MPSAKIISAAIVFLGLLAFCCGCFTHTFSLRTERFSPTVASVDNFVVFMYGRMTSSREILSDAVDILDARTLNNNPKTWLSLRMHTSRISALTATIGKKIIVVGGMSANEAVMDVELLDFETNPPTISVIGTIEYYREPISMLHHMTIVENEVLVTLRNEGLLVFDYTMNTTTIKRYDSVAGYPFGPFQGFRSSPLVPADNAAYIIFERGILRYDTLNKSMTFTHYSFEFSEINDERGVIAAFNINGMGYLVTPERIILLRLETGEAVTLHRLSTLASRALVHGDNLLLFTGPSRGVVNAVTTMNTRTKVKFSLPYTRYNFASEDFVVTANADNLYVVGWTFNSPIPSTQVLVYDIANSRHRFTPLGFSNLQVFYEHSDRLHMITYDDHYNRTLIVYNMVSGRYITLPLESNYLYTSAFSTTGSNQIYFRAVNLAQEITDKITIYNPDTNQLRQVNIPNGEEVNELIAVGTKLFVDRRSQGLPISQLDVFDTATEQWSAFNISTPQLEFFMLNKGNKLVVFPYNFAMLHQFDVYDFGRSRWATIQMETPRRFTTSEIVDDILYISGGVSEQGQLLASIEVHNLNTLTKVHSMQLKEARRLIVIESLPPYLVFAGGELADGALSAQIEIYNTNNRSWPFIASNILFPQPELIGLNFGISLVDSRVIFRYNNYVNILDLDNLRIDPLMIPFMSGYGSHVIGTNIVFYGQYGRLSVYFFYEVMTGSVFQINTPSVPEGKHTLLWRNQFVFWMNGIAIVPVPLMLNTLSDQHVFMNQSVEFYINATGNALRYSWRLNDRPLNATESSLVIPQNQLQNGVFSVQLVDHCQATASQSASLTVEPRPTFSTEFSEAFALCNSVARFAVKTTGREVQVNWKLNGDWLDQSGHTIDIDVSHLSCGSKQRICAFASNPSGTLERCSDLQLLDRRQVFDGPQPTWVNPFLTKGSHIKLQVNVIYDRCTNHSWFQDNSFISMHDSFFSEYEIEIGKDAQPGSTIHVVAICGGSQLRSEPFTVPQTTIPIWAFFLLLFGGLGIAAAIIAITLIYYRRLRKAKDQEHELQIMLSKAHEETIAQRNNKGAQLISCVTWEWEPDASFSFAPIDNFPVRVDTSHLSFGKKSDLLEVDVWTQGTLQISSKKTKKRARISSFLNQRLIEDAPQITIYAPQSPKFEVKVSPETFNLEDGSDVTVTVSVRLRITTKVKIKLLIVLDNQRIYSSIDFPLASLPSPWIDLEEIHISDEFLGRGGFGSVVRGTYKGQDVAVKTLKEDTMQEQEKKEFDREVMIMRSLRHPNIVQFIGASNIMKRVAIVTELAPLGSLASLLAKDFLLSYPLKLEILLEIAKAIQFLHANDVIHRDIKPGNVLVFSLEPKATIHVKVSDFGTSKFVAEQVAPMTKNMGTVNYNAPETVGKNPLYTFSADIFSFAIMMWEVITNEPSFSVAIHPDFAFEYKIEEHIVEGRRLEIPRDVEPRLAALITDCWAHDPKQRPSSDNLVQRLSALVQEMRNY